MDEQNFKILLGKRIKQIRNTLGLTQEAFCNKIQLEIPNLSNIENGKSYPSMQTLWKIITAFDIEPNELFNFSFYENSEIVTKLLCEYIDKLSFNKKVFALKMLMLINEESKTKNE